VFPQNCSSELRKSSESRPAYAFHAISTCVRTTSPLVSAAICGELQRFPKLRLFRILGFRIFRSNIEVRSLPPFPSPSRQTRQRNEMMMTSVDVSQSSMSFPLILAVDYLMMDEGAERSHSRKRSSRLVE